MINKKNGFILLEVLVYTVLLGVLVTLVFAHSAALVVHARRAMTSSRSVCSVYALLSALRADIDRANKPALVRMHECTIFTPEQTIIWALDSEHARLTRKTHELASKNAHTAVSSVLDHVQNFLVKNEDATNRGQYFELELSHNGKFYVSCFFIPY